ncbi:hypothetical protein Patl1_32320 [Pistacia atlantica]|uniref:Uncharacterized protein n=1 Tax=Pistacia atlantica TaxID=434234 RepID=A0ACC1APC6_9ROSI|nr:hypothetical protein Patl1_32320 [Pistacia atlantica]
MDGSASKAEVIKPVLLKAGIPLGLSVAAFFYARIMAKRSVLSKEEALENQVSSIKTDSFEELGDEEEGEEIIRNTHLMNNLVGVSSYQDKVDYEQEILGLRNQVEDLEKREWEMKRQLVHYHDLKEQESMLMEIKCMLLLEKGHVDLLDREISSMEAENRRVENLVVEYLRVLEQLQYWKSESGLLRRKVKKLLKKAKEQSCIIREKNLKIEATEEEILSSRNTIEQKSNVVRKLQDEMGELQSVIDQLQESNRELLSKVQLAEQSASLISKIEDEGITMEDYKQLVDEYEQLQKDRAG